MGRGPRKVIELPGCRVERQRTRSFLLFCALGRIIVSDGFTDEVPRGAAPNVFAGCPLDRGADPESRG